MANNFNWRTDEEFDWDEEEITAAPRQRAPLAWQRPARILAVLLLVGAAVFLVTRRAREQVDETTAEVNEDVLSSFDLLLRATEKADRELFLTLLSGRDAGWTEAQKMLLDSGLIFGRQTFNLQLDRAGLDENRPVAENITLSSDFTAAEVTFRAPYAAEVGNGLSVPIVLEQTQVYRRGNDQRWLLSPPLEDFWGAWATIAGQRLRVRYPLRDEALATRLAADLDSRLGAMCRLPGVVCPVDLRVELRLGEEPGTLLTGLDKETQIAGGPSFNLPAPTLVGIPVDEAGYQALLRGYAGHIVSALLTGYSGYECCDHPLFYQALLDFQLNQLAIQAWPLAQEDYGFLLNTAPPASKMFQIWSEPFDPLRERGAWQQVYALVDFVLSSETTTSVPEMQRMLNRHATFSGWLYGLIDFPYYDEPAVNQAWLQFLYDKADLVARVPPRPFPEESMALVCLARVLAGPTEIVRYDLETMTATDTLAIPGSDFDGREVYPLPDGRIVAHTLTADGEFATIVIEEGAEPLVIDLPVDGLNHNTRVESYAANGSLIFRHDQVLNRDRPSYSLFVPAECTRESCRSQRLPGRVELAPDGAHALAFTPLRDSAVGAAQLLGADLLPLQGLGSAWGGGWFDDDTFYILGLDGIYRGSVGDSRLQTLVDRASLRSLGFFSASTEEESLFFSSATPNPNNPEQMLVAFSAIDSEQEVFGSQLLLLDLTDGEIRIEPFPAPETAGEDPLLASYYVEVEAHGPWIQLLSFSPLTSTFMGTIQIVDWRGRIQNTLTTQGFNNLNDLRWSPDHNWLIVMDQRWTRVLAVGSDYQRLLFRGNDDGCSGGYWAPARGDGVDS